MGDLLPCPFCGSSNIGHTGRKTLAHSCADCEARGPTTEGALENEDTWGRAEIAWNTRAPTPSATQAGGWMPPEVPLAVKEAFANSVWDALKADANDLRKQRRIVRAFDAAFAPLPPAPEASAQREEARKG